MTDKPNEEDLKQPDPNEFMPSISSDGTAENQRLELLWRNAEQARVDAVAENQRLKEDLAGVEASNDAMEVNLKSLATHGSCACDYDKPGDVCAHHSPALMKQRKLLKVAEEALIALLKVVCACPPNSDDVECMYGQAREALAKIRKAVTPSVPDTENPENPKNCG